MVESVQAQQNNNETQNGVDANQTEANLDPNSYEYKMANTQQPKVD